MKKKTESPSPDAILLYVTGVLIVMGTLMISSSSVIMAEARWRSPYMFVFKHLIWVCIGAVSMYLISIFDYRKLQEYSRPLTIICVALLLLVLVIGTVKSGARRWFRLGFISFQPSELAKIAMVVALADYIDRKKSRLVSLSGVVYGLVVAAVLFIPIVPEPDIGTPFVMMVVALGMLYAAGAKFSHIALIGASVIPFIAVEIIRKPYRLIRFRDYLESWGDITSGSYQLNQSLLALGSGGLIGKGLAQSQMKLLYLPEPHTDFIFPVIGEEMGLAGTLFILCLFLVFAWRGWVISRQSKDLFGSMLALGITWLITFQALLNTGVACGLFPTKGLPLPFVSFGGTSLVFYMIGVGILLNISRQGSGNVVRVRA